MDYIIRIKDGMPFEHPIAIENFVQIYPDVDLNNLPAEFAPFEKATKQAKLRDDGMRDVEYVFEGSMVVEKVLSEPDAISQEAAITMNQNIKVVRMEITRV